jgi:hypothetical protein
MLKSIFFLLFIFGILCSTTQSSISFNDNTQHNLTAKATTCSTYSIRVPNLQLTGEWGVWWGGVETNTYCEDSCYGAPYGINYIGWTRQKSTNKCWCMMYLYTDSPGGYGNTDYDAGFYPNISPGDEACQSFALENQILNPNPPVDGDIFTDEGVCQSLNCGTEFWYWLPAIDGGTCYCISTNAAYANSAITYKQGAYLGFNQAH